MNMVFFKEQTTLAALEFQEVGKWTVKLSKKVSRYGGWQSERSGMFRKWSLTGRSAARGNAEQIEQSWLLLGEKFILRLL